MSEYKPRVGDKIRVVHEGLVTEVGDGRSKPSFVIDDADFEYWEGEGMAVELLEPAGFKPGTVAVSRLAPGSPALRQGDGRWGPERDWSDLTDERVRTNRYFTVVYEPAS